MIYIEGKNKKLVHNADTKAPFEIADLVLLEYNPEGVVATIEEVT